MEIKFLSWNVNGLRALLKKSQWDWLQAADAQIIALQETKAEPGQLPQEVAQRPGWHCYWDSSVVKKGYSGVAVFSKPEPLAASAQLPAEAYQGEGRLLHLEYPEFHFFNVYFPNGGALEIGGDGSPRFKRLEYKLGFYEEFLRLALECDKGKPVVVCGDFNVARHEIDLANPKENMGVSGFLPEERAMVERLADAGFVDAFRHVHGQEEGRYTWWSYQRNARKRNIGWRIDYFFVSERLAPKISSADILDGIEGSDHCPVALALNL